MTEGDYAGEVDVRGRPHGTGQMVFHNRSVYSGRWAEGHRHGQGEMVFSSGNRFKGSFCLNKRHGRGKFFYKELGDVYEGDWKNDMKDGKGEYRFRNGTVFRGSFERDQRHGYGWKILPNSVYCGNYSQGQKQGIFKFVLLNTEETSLVEYNKNKKIRVRSMGKLKPSDKAYLEHMGIRVGGQNEGVNPGNYCSVGISTKKTQRYSENEKFQRTEHRTFKITNSGVDRQIESCETGYMNSAEGSSQSQLLSPVQERLGVSSVGPNFLESSPRSPSLPTLQNESNSRAQSIAISKAQNRYKQMYNSKLLSEIGEVSEKQMSVASFCERRQLFHISDRFSCFSGNRDSFQIQDSRREGVNFISREGGMSVQTMLNLDEVSGKKDIDEDNRSTIDSQIRRSNCSLLDLNEQNFD